MRAAWPANFWWGAGQEYIKSRLEAGFDSSYLRQLLDYTVYVIGCLEAPARQTSTQQACASVQPLTHPIGFNATVQCKCVPVM